MWSNDLHFYCHLLSLLYFFWFHVFQAEFKSPNPPSAFATVLSYRTYIILLSEVISDGQTAGFVRAAQLGRIDTTQLDELERELNSAEVRLEDARIEERYSDLEDLSTQTSTWITEYGHQLTVLLQDVENIRAINATIPRECFRKIILEPADPRG